MSITSKKRIILLIGLLGAGKSAALRMLAELGHATLDADGLGQRVLRKAAAGYRQLMGPNLLPTRPRIRSR
ncbi:MAG: hypothetical protein V1755_14380 [Chloroflexota bacterium]